MSSVIPEFRSEPSSLAPLHQMLVIADQKHLVSRLYHTVHTHTPRRVVPARDRWSAALGEPVTVEQWAYCCRQTARISASCRLRVIHYKFLLQLYCTPVKKYRFGLADNDRCERCKQPGADFLHLAWSCPRLQDYWAQVLAALGRMTGIANPEDPMVALLGYTEHIPAPFRKYAAIALLLAKRQVACRWGRGRAPKFKVWIHDLVYCQDQLSIYAETLPRASRPRDIWSPFQVYLIGEGAQEAPTV